MLTKFIKYKKLANYFVRFSQKRHAGAEAIDWYEGMDHVYNRVE